MAKKKGLCDSFCKGCVYEVYATHEQKMCNYYIATGIRRPCPAGTGCTVKKTGKKVGKWELDKVESYKRRKEKTKEVLHRVCPYCGTAFDTEYTTKIYCSKKCVNKVAQKAWRKRKEVRHG